jgi:hypothetical protein
MRSVLVLLGLLALTAVPVVALLRADPAPGSARRPWVRRPAPPPAPGGRPLERVAADVRRLARATELVPAGTPMARRRGLEAAYDDVLAEAAAMLGVPQALRTTPAGRAREVERLRVRAALQDAGLAVRR